MSRINNEATHILVNYTCYQNEELFLRRMFQFGDAPGADVKSHM